MNIDRVDGATVPYDATATTDSTADNALLTIQRHWYFTIWNNGPGTVGSASISATSGLNFSMTPPPPWTAGPAQLLPGVALRTSAVSEFAFATASAAPGFSSSRTISPLLIPPGGTTQSLTVSFTLDSAPPPGCTALCAYGQVEVDVSPTGTAGDAWTFIGSSPTAQVSSNPSGPGGLDIWVNNPTPGTTYTLSFSGSIPNLSTHAFAYKPQVGIQPTTDGLSAVQRVIASSLALTDPVLAGTATFSFNDNYQLQAFSRNSFGIAYNGGGGPPDPTSSGVGCAPSSAVAGQSVTCATTVTDTAQGFQTPPTGTVTWSTSGTGSFGNGGTCTLAPDSGSFNSSSCSVSYTPAATPADPVRTDTITGSYSGDSTHAGSVSFYPGAGPGPFVTVISPTVLATGTFVIGDQNATVGNSVTFWGAQWSAFNILSGGPAPAGFKGFVSNPASDPPQCGAQWTSRPGNSSDPPVTIPRYMAVIVASSITKSGSTISGNTPEVVVVKTNDGYASNPGHAGTGTVVAAICQN